MNKKLSGNNSFKAPLSIVLCFARSGGTLLNRWLLNSEDTVIMSEVNPVNEEYGKLQQTIKWQAKEWYGIDIRGEGYVNQVLELYEWCIEHEKHLVIREWPYIDFMPCELNGYKTTDVCSTYELLKSKIDMRVMAFVRDSIDVYLSLEPLHSDINKFMFHYNKYVEYICKNKIYYVKYEDFCKDPNNIGKNICLNLSLRTFENQDVKLKGNQKLTGDTLVSRGNVSNSVMTLKRKYAKKSIRCSINKNILMKESNDAFLYPLTYEARRYDSLFETMITTVKCTLLNVARRVYSKVSSYGK